MTDEKPSRASTPTPFQPTSLPASVGNETRVAMDLAGIQGVERRQKVARLIGIAVGAVAVIAILYALLSSGPADDEGAAAPAAMAPAAEPAAPAPAAVPAPAAEPAPAEGAER